MTNNIAPVGLHLASRDRPSLWTCASCEPLELPGGRKLDCKVDPPSDLQRHASYYPTATPSSRSCCMLFLAAHTLLYQHLRWQATSVPTPNCHRRPSSGSLGSFREPLSFTMPPLAVARAILPECKILGGLRRVLSTRVRTFIYGGWIDGWRVCVCV